MFSILQLWLHHCSRFACVFEIDVSIAPSDKASHAVTFAPHTLNERACKWEHAVGSRAPYTLGRSFSLVFHLSKAQGAARRRLSKPTWKSQAKNDVSHDACASLYDQRKDYEWHSLSSAESGQTDIQWRYFCASPSSSAPCFSVPDVHARRRLPMPEFLRKPIFVQASPAHRV